MRKIEIPTEMKEPTKLLIIIGKAAAGKSFLVKYLQTLGIQKWVTYTTRPMRQGEENHVDYYFVSNEQFDALIEQDFFFEHTAFKVENSYWKYGVPKQKGITGGTYALILDPNGFRKFMCDYWKNHRADLEIMSMLLDIDEKERYHRQIDRGDNILEIAMREGRDTPVFTNIEREVDYIVDNDLGKVWAILADAGWVKTKGTEWKA